MINYYNKQCNLKSIGTKIVDVDHLVSSPFYLCLGGGGFACVHTKPACTRIFTE